METDKETSPSFLRRYRWPLLITLIIGLIGAFYTYQKQSGFAFSNYFTTYDEPLDSSGYYAAVKDSLLDIPPLVAPDSTILDTVSQKEEPDSLFGFALPVYDSLPPIGQDSLAVVDSSRAETVLVQDSSSTLVPTPPDPRTAPAPAATPESAGTEDIFDGLLPATFQSPDAEQVFRATYTARTVSTRGIYKLAAIAGRSLLIDATPEVLEMLNVLAAEEAIASLVVSDRVGRIVYTSNPRERNRMVSAVYPDLPVTNEAINWLRQDGLTTTGIPVFSVGGRVGTVFVTTE
ncbi:hypothetical protein [Lewinella sp. W8]|uniref:hypothetical protein n=1 Tax=Lewinella sp. W8 TaxID=2528208 RepID=UPI001067A3EE|nr:hypothetical protein [Lewinella sp. W8]MTB51225.1 hypothetical protein [Lewinella sp. W8]